MADLIAVRRLRRRRLRFRNVIQWKIVDREDPFSFTDRTFIQQFRLSKDAVRDLCEIIKPHMIDVKEAGRYSVEMQVLSSLYFLGSGNFQRVTSKSAFTQISQSSVSRFLQKFVDATWEISPQYIQFPVDAHNLLSVKTGFYEKWGFPNCVGALDCTHVHIRKPTEDDNFVFLNRHGRYSVNVQMVCDQNLRILNVVARWPGGSHDSYIWRGSKLRRIFAENFIPDKNFLLGDSGYPLEPWLMTPYAVETLQRHKKYNEVHRRARNVVERCFGVLKSRFRCLHDTGGILQYAPNKVCRIIIACAVLHNICIRYNVPTDACDDNSDQNDTGDIPPDNTSSPIDADMRAKAVRFREEISLHV